MQLNLVVYSLLISLFLTNVVVVVTIEPITMGIGALAMGKHKCRHVKEQQQQILMKNLCFFPDSQQTGASYWLFGSKDGRERRDSVVNKVNNYFEWCDSKHIIYDIDGLKADLKERLFGQHIVNATLIPQLRAHVRNLERSEKPLVMSFHGRMGTGKNFVTELIIKHFYKKGEHSKFVHKKMARKDFPLDLEVNKYRVSHSMRFIRSNIQICPISNHFSLIFPFA